MADMAPRAETTKDEIRTVTMSQVEEYVKFLFSIQRMTPEGILIDAPRAPMLWGQPGIGKSELFEQMVRRGDLERDRTESEYKKDGKNRGDYSLLIDIRLSLMEPTDIRGLPYFDAVATTMKWAPPDELPSMEEAEQYDCIILLLDEIASAMPSVQAACYQLTLNRRIGPYILPPNVRIALAGNRLIDGGTYQMPQALRNRLIHFHVNPDFDSWYNWATEVDMQHPLILSYLSTKPGKLNGYVDPKSTDDAYNTPRTWAFLSDILYHAERVNLPDADFKNIAVGTIGHTAIDFCAWRDRGQKLPQPMDVIEGKVKTIDTKMVSSHFFLTYAIADNLRQITLLEDFDQGKFNKQCNNAILFIMNNFEKEIAVMAIRILSFTYHLPYQAQEMECFEMLFQRLGETVLKGMTTAKEKNKEREKMKAALSKDE